jgi:hypothetical protein
LRKVSGAWYSAPHSQTVRAVVQRLRKNGTFRPRRVNRGPERTPRVLDLEPQTLETVEKNPSTSTWQLVSDIIIVLEIIRNPG